jgi:hypothetical protein
MRNKVSLLKNRSVYLLLAIGLWAIFVLVSYSQVWMGSFGSFVDLINMWKGGGWLLYVHLIGFSIFLVALDRFKLSPAKRTLLLISFFFISFLILVLLAHDLQIVSKMLLCIGWLLVVGMGIKFYVDDKTKLELPLYAGILMVLIFISSICFFAGIFGFANYSFCVGLAVLLFAFSLFQSREKYKNYFREGHSSLEKWTVENWIFGEGVFLVFCISFVHAFTPEILVDAVSLHLPKASRIIESGSLQALSEFPYYPYSLILSSVHLTFGFFYALAGEYGVNSLTCILVLIFSALICHINRELSVKEPFSLSAAVLFLVVPAYIWHFGCGYIDMIANVFGVAGVAFLLRGLKVDKKWNVYYLVAGIFFGVAVSSKITLSVFAVIFLGFTGIIILQSKRDRLSQVLSNYIFPAGIGFLFFSLPYLCFHYFTTGNPFFPTLGEFFPSKYFNSMIDMQSYQSFEPVGILEWLIFPFTLVMHTSLFGSAVEYLDGTAGVWFLLFFPFVVTAFLKSYREPTFLLVFWGSISFIVVLALLGTWYMRYYIPSVVLLFCIMAKGISVSRFKEKYLGIGIPIFILIFSVPQWTFGSVWAPTVSHWNYYHSGAKMDWLDKHYPGFKTFDTYYKELPKPPRVFAINFEGISHLPKETTFFRSIDIILSGLFSLKLSDQNIDNLKNDFWGFFKTFQSGQLNNIFEQKEVDEVISRHGDMVVFNSMNDLLIQKKSKFIGIERLLHSTSQSPGAYSRFFLAFGVNDLYFPPDQGDKIKIESPEEETLKNNSGPYAWNFFKPVGGLEARKNKGDIWSENLRFLQKKFEIPDNALGFKMVLDLKFNGPLDYYPNVQLNWTGKDGQITQMNALGVFYWQEGVSVFSLMEIPKDADEVTLIVRPNPEKKVSVMDGEILFVL